MFSQKNNTLKKNFKTKLCLILSFIYGQKKHKTAIFQFLEKAILEELRVITILQGF